MWAISSLRPFSAQANMAGLFLNAHMQAAKQIRLKRSPKITSFQRRNLPLKAKP